jgi:hypothetical protein
MLRVGADDGNIQAELRELLMPCPNSLDPEMRVPRSLGAECGVRPSYR